MIPSIAANASHMATIMLAPSSPQKRAFTPRYVARKLTGSFQIRCETKLRVAPPITIRLKRDPATVTPMPPIRIKT